jgi:hypothetical protein
MAGGGTEAGHLHNATIIVDIMVSLADSMRA